MKSKTKITPAYSYDLNMILLNNLAGVVVTFEKLFGGRRLSSITYPLTSLLLIIFGVGYFFNPIVQTFIQPNNFINEELNVQNGLNILKYETESLSTYDTTADFNNQNYSADQFETGSDDLESYTNLSTNDVLALNHYGDNRPDVGNNGDWWDDDSDSSTKYNWRYRQCFGIDYSSGVSNLTEYQLYLDFDTITEISAGKMQSAGEDIRIVDTSGNVIDHYIADDINTDSTRIWIQPDTITAGATTNYCMYYGNATAVSTSDQEAVFTYTNPEDIYYALGEGQDGESVEYGSYTDSNSTSVGSSSETLDQYDVYGQSGGGSTPDPLAQTSSIESLGPVQPTFDLNGTESFIPASNAGTQFVYRMERGTQEFSFVSPHCSADIEIRNSTNTIVAGGSFTVAQGASALYTETGTTPNFSGNDTAIIESTNGCPFLVYHGATNNNDTLVMYPATTEWYGVGSGRLEFAVLEDTTDVFVYGSDNYFAEYSVANGNALNRGDNIEYNGSGSDGSDPAFHLVANKPISANSLADSDGSEAASFFPRDQMGTRFIIPANAQYVAIAGVAGATTTVNLWNDATQCGIGVPDESITLTQTAGNANNPYKGFFGDTAEGQEYAAGTCIESDRPIAPYFERELGDDETQLYSYKQNRQYIHLAPTISDAVFEVGAWSLGTGSTFSNRIPVTITNNSTTAIDEYNLPINLSNLTSSVILDTNAQTNGGDIRVAGSVGDGSDNLNFLLEEFDNAQDDGYIWVQSPSITGSSSSTIYIYFNSNNTETTTSNAETTFTRSTKQTSFYVVDEYAAGIDPAHRIYSFIDDNEMDYRGISYTDFDAGRDYTTADDGSSNGNGITTQGDAFAVNGPINASHFADGVDNINPISWAGTKFLSVDSRYEDEYSILAPFGNSDVSFERHNGTSWVAFGADVNLIQGVSQNIIRDTNSTSATTPANAVRITSTTPVIIHRHANSGGVPLSDSQLLYPVEEAYEESTGEYILYGVGSNGIMLATENATTNITIYYDDATDSGNIAITAADSNAYIATGGVTQGQGRGMKVVADGPIFAASQADSDGNESATYLPKKEFGTEFLFVTGTQYVTIVSNDQSTVCEIFDDLDASVTSVTLGTNSATYVNQGELGNFVSGGTAQYQAGYYMICDDPVYAYFEKNGDDSDANITDESTFLTFAQGRQKALIEPIVTDIDDVSVLEEGLYFESGWDMDTTATDPEAFVDIIIDSADEDVFWDEFRIAEEVFNTAQVSQNNVDRYKLEISSINDNNCLTATYPAFQEVSLDFGDLNVSIPDQYSDNNCILFRLSLRTGDQAHSPIIDQLEVSYYNPTSLEGVLNSPVVTISGSDEDKRLRALKFSTSNTTLTNSQSYLSYLDSANNSVFSNLDLVLYSISTDTLLGQFDWPPLPGSPEDASNTSVFDDSNSVAMYVTNNRTLGTGNSSIDLSYRTNINNANGPLLDREFSLIIQD